MQPAQPDTKKDNYIFRCAVIGNKKVGKTSFIEHYLDGPFNDNGPTTDTAVVEREKKNIEVGNFNIWLKISDFPTGLENTSGGMTTKAFVFLVYDITSRESFDKLEDFIENFNFNNKNPNKLLYIIANKSDKGAR